MRHLRFILIAAVSLGACSAEAQVVICAKPTRNMACSGGVCAATAKKAVLNAADLDAMLEAGDVRVASGTVAKDIEIKTAVDWTSASRLTLDAWLAIAIDKPVTVAGSGALTITTNDGGFGGDYRFAGKGRVQFLGEGGNLVINGNEYPLAASVAQIANIARGHYPYVALKRNIGAGRKIYSASPVPSYEGTVEGLGNTISNLTIRSATDAVPVGLFGRVYHGNTLQVQIRDIGLISVDIAGTGDAQAVGALAGENQGDAVLDVYATGRVSASGRSSVGGLIGDNESGNVSLSHANVAVSGGANVLYVGGLIGSAGGDCVYLCNGVIDSSYSQGTVSGGDGANVGGLLGYSFSASISNSYATGAVGAGSNAFVGGLVGTNGVSGAAPVPLSASYSTGTVSGGSGSAAGGLIGQDLIAADITDMYWDMDTSGVGDPAQGAGNIANDPGIAGLTTIQLQSGLPTGFGASIWAEKAGVNGGLPYLRDQPPN